MRKLFVSKSADSFPNCFEAALGDQRARFRRRAGLTGTPLKMRCIRMRPVSTPTATVLLEDGGDLPEPALAAGRVPIVGSVDHIDRQTVAVPAGQVGRRVRYGTCRRDGRAAARIIKSLEIVAQLGLI